MTANSKDVALAMAPMFWTPAPDLRLARSDAFPSTFKGWADMWPTMLLVGGGGGVGADDGEGRATGRRHSKGTKPSPGYSCEGASGTWRQAVERARGYEAALSAPLSGGPAQWTPC